jgi:phosphotransferase system HPr-like phosphotransfer protein
MVKITHLTSAHARHDTRIFIKMCSSLAKNKNYDVSLVVADGKSNEIKNSVNIIDIGAKTGGRISRMTTTVKKVFQNENILHCNDLNALPAGVIIKKFFNKNIKIVYDAHEYETEINGLSGIQKTLTKLLEKSLIKL